MPATHLTRIEPLLPPPCDLGVPARFDSWRSGQDRMVLDALTSTKRFVLLNAPTGIGKSCAYMVHSLLADVRTCVLTSTKGLSQQVFRDFETCGLFEVKGMNNYSCKAAQEEDGINERIMCDQGKCHSGVRCPLLDAGCSYFDAVRTARASQLVTSNYQFWMTQYRYSKGLGEFGLLVLDEAHDARLQLESFLAVELDTVEAGLAGQLLLPADAALKDWADWAKGALKYSTERIETLQREVQHSQSDGRHGRSLMREIRDLKGIVKKLQTLASVEGEWVISHSGRKVCFDPLTPAAYAERFLFLNIPKVIMTSATLSRKTAQVLGVKPEDMDYFEYPSPFPPKNRRVIHVPTVRVNSKMSEMDRRIWMSRIDQIVSARLDRKGILHTVSYERARYVLQHSEWRELMYFHDSHSTRSVVMRFKEADAPAVLVSPSVSTGWDFPMDETRYQIIGKIPFMDTRSAILQARRKLDPDFEMYTAWQTFIQMCGRSTRSEQDKSEILCVDDNMVWFVPKYGCGCRDIALPARMCKNKHFAPRWFLDAIVWASGIPEPLKLEG